MTIQLTRQEQKILLDIAREAIEMTAKGEQLLPIVNEKLPPRLLELGACFVTLNKSGQLRGCVGSIAAIQPLVQDVRERSVCAAFKDPRFPPVHRSEVKDLRIEISTLTEPAPVFYDHPLDLPTQLQVGVDGVILIDGFRRATFLPQVWEKLPDPELFLSRLCLKMGLEADAWRSRKMDVEVYQVEKFTEFDL